MDGVPVAAFAGVFGGGEGDVLSPLLLRASYPGEPWCELSGDEGLSMSQGMNSWWNLKGGWADTVLVQEVGSA